MWRGQTMWEVIKPARKTRKEIVEEDEQETGQTTLG